MRLGQLMLRRDRTHELTQANESPMELEIPEHESAPAGNTGRYASALSGVGKCAALNDADECNWGVALQHAQA